MIAAISHAIRWVLTGLVRAYQSVISPLLPSSCRFVPSCSDYALEALQRKPILVALGLIAWRLLRCQPLCRCGFDPVPPDRGKPDPAGRAVFDDQA